MNEILTQANSLVEQCGLRRGDNVWCWFVNQKLMVTKHNKKEKIGIYMKQKTGQD